VLGAPLAEGLDVGESVGPGLCGCETITVGPEEGLGTGETGPVVGGDEALGGVGGGDG